MLNKIQTGHLAEAQRTQSKYNVVITAEAGIQRLVIPKPFILQLTSQVTGFLHLLE